MNKYRYIDNYFKLYHELANLQSAQETPAEMRRVEHCIKLLQNIDVAVYQK